MVKGDKEKEKLEALRKAVEKLLKPKETEKSGESQSGKK